MLSDAVKMKLQSLFLYKCDCPGHPYVRVCADCIRGIVSFAVAEAVAANDKAWLWQLNNPNSMADMVKAAHVQKANKEAVAAEREACVTALETLKPRPSEIRTGPYTPTAAWFAGVDDFRRQGIAAIRARGESDD